MKKYEKLHTDCFMKKNPGKWGGWTIATENGEIVKRHDFKGEALTNNQLELLGIIDGLIHIKQGGEIITDAQFCERTINGQYKVGKKNILGGLFEIAKSIKLERDAKIIWKQREKNLAGIYNDKVKETKNINQNIPF